MSCGCQSSGLAPTEPCDRISLATPLSRSMVREVIGSRSVSIQIVTDDWGSAVVRAVWSVNGTDWVAFTPDIQFSSSQTGRERIALAGIVYFALEIVTADGAADSSAEVWSLRT